MPKKTPKTSASALKKGTERVEAARGAFLKEMNALKKARRQLVERIRKRFEKGAIERLRNDLKNIT